MVKRRESIIAHEQLSGELHAQVKQFMGTTDHNDTAQPHYPKQDTEIFQTLRCPTSSQVDNSAAGKVHVTLVLMRLLTT